MFLIYMAYKFLIAFISYKRKIDEFRRRRMKRRIEELEDTDYEEIE
jgi:hypothetical protein